MTYSERFQQTLIYGLLLSLIFIAVPSSAFAAGPKDVSVRVTKSVGDLKEVSAKVTVNAPPQFVWQTLTAYNEIASFIPGYKKCKVLSQKGSVSTLDVDMSISRFMPSYKYQVQVHENAKALQLNLHRVSGDFKQMDGTYRLYATGNGAKTVVVYNLKVDSGVNIPGSNGILKSNVEKGLLAVRSRSEKKHQKSLIGKK